MFTFNLSFSNGNFKITSYAVDTYRVAEDGENRCFKNILKTLLFSLENAILIAVAKKFSYRRYRNMRDNRRREHIL